MKILGIYCAGGAGREIAELALRINNNRWENIIFIDDNPDFVNLVNGIEVYRFDEAVNKFKDEKIEFVISSGEPGIRRIIYNKLNENNFKLINILHTKLVNFSYIKIGFGNIIDFGSQISCNVDIGNNNYINRNVSISHDTVIGDNCVISPGAVITGCVSIGNDVFIGAGSVIRNGIRIGDSAIVGMGAVVINDVSDNTVVVGNPAKIIGSNERRRVFNNRDVFK